ncbi:MAG: EexN family lipoprotein [Woeseia sp.]
MKYITIAICAVGALAACDKEVPPHTVAEFLEDPILLEATMVRCGQNRAASRHEVVCVNAREAVDRLAVAEEQAKREELEAQSEKKRQALRRAREAAAEARRRAQEEEQKAQDAIYFGEFEPASPDAGDSGVSPDAESSPPTLKQD